MLLGDLNLTHVVKQDVLWITTVDEAQRLLQKDAIDPATYWKSSQVAAASRKKLAEALKKPIQVEFNRTSLGRDSLSQKGLRCRDPPRP